MRGEIRLGIAPQSPRGLEIDQAQHRDDDGCRQRGDGEVKQQRRQEQRGQRDACRCIGTRGRSEEHTSELQSLMRISYAVFCLKKKKGQNNKEKEVTRSKRATIQDQEI